MTEYVIERLGHQGDGIAAGPIFVPMALPGEVVSGDVEGNRLTNMRVVEPSGDRVKAPCRHYKACGGCLLQHASDDFVSNWKLEVVRSALAGQSLEADLKPIQTSPPNSRRRAVISAKRTKKGAMAGFHARASGVITEITDCKLVDPALLPATEIAIELAKIGGSRKGELSVTATLSPVGLDLAVTGGKSLDGPLQSVLAQATERFMLARLSWDGEVIAMRSPPYQTFGNANVVPPPGAFLQATAHGESALLAAVLGAITQGERGIDLFAGCGTFTLPMAKRAQMHGVEVDGAMTKALDAGWRRAQGLKQVTVETRDLFRNPIIAADLGYDFAVIDPPRAGAEAQIKELAQSKINEIAYISCNPVTFARDAAILVKSGYGLDWIQVVDQFRWSSHVELAARFSKT
ncbi:class I SAM-dependent RNA methyltransferase [Shimia abyssi]|uniref:23S rRNA m(5)U-1939 methyltransferase n=1 Tax=Shimia abyssi TaxID=1662395 RepID=A0A2P8F8D6_9RHOB|nr:class I SAM-dependent RNA methyltransferase [Shimia abyssi]PSL17986.1 23S rRNA m(5)U-1939 methyltransferase [Shimia abyssi]